MNLRQQIIKDRVEQTAKNLGVSEDEAFLRLTHSIIVGQSIHAFDQGDVVDGGQDKQIDAITIEQDDDQATVYILQFKNTESFSSNALIQMRNGLEWVFKKSKSDLANLSNVPFRDRVLEYRSVQSGLGPANIEVVVGYVTNGTTDVLSDEFNQEAKTIADQYNNGTFGSFEFRAWGADELVEQINTLEKGNRKVDADIPIRYDANNPSLIKYHAEGLKGIICTASAREIARIVNSDATGSVFDANIRRFLGSRGAVNSDIRRTCSRDENSHLFWFLNNGITIVCDSADPVTDPDNAHIKVKNLQIVNGCQTATTLALAERDGVLAQDVRVLLRIYETANKPLVDKIVLTTNNQNKISSRDLRANDQVQIDMERGFQPYGLLYERKVRQFDSLPNVDSTKIVANETVAQSYLAIVLKTPSDARRRKYKVWGELYGRIFGGHAVAPYVLAVQNYRYTGNWLRESPFINDTDDVRRKIARNGAFHIARIASFLWRGSDKWKDVSDQVEREIEELGANPSRLDRHLRDAVTFLQKLISETDAYSRDIDAALKSANLDADISSRLHRQRKRNAAAPRP